jgi:hypothetical protein
MVKYIIDNASQCLDQIIFNRIHGSNRYSQHERKTSQTHVKSLLSIVNSPVRL